MAGIVRSTDRMARLIDDMMTLTKAELEQLPMQNVTVRLDEVVHEAAEELRPVFKDKGISLSLQNLPRAVVLGDRSSLHRLFSNLLQNALRYTDAGGHVSVNMEVNAFNARVAVVDTGIGMSADDLSRIFDRFYRADKSRTRAAGGSGLGLSIVKAICEHHKGSVSADSVEGKGSTFTVTLPVSTPLRSSIQKIFALTKP